MLDLNCKALTVQIKPAPGRPDTLVVHLNDEEKCVVRAYVPASEFRLDRSTTLTDKPSRPWTTEK